MPVYKVNVKWGKEKFSEIECNTDEAPLIFKSALYSLTGVVPERMKVMVKGKAIGDDTWTGIKNLKNNITMMMMGSASELPPEPAEKTQFIEDMSESQVNQASEYPPGLHNLGNTCYMAATLQCLKTVPELKEKLKQSSGQFTRQSMVGSEGICAAMKQLYTEMDKTSESVTPLVMLKVLHMTFPRFAERGEGGVFQQQDANECWTEVMRMMSEYLPGEGSTNTETVRKSYIEQYFGGENVTMMKCSETDAEPETKSIEKWTQLRCHINTDVRYMQLGLTMGLKENIEKTSATLGRNAVYVKTSNVNRLPSYLTINFIRFFYKEKENINAKVLKDIKFPMEYDAFELCTPELQAKITPARDRFEALRMKKVEIELSGDVKNKKNEEKKEEKEVNYESCSFPDDLGSSNSGYYELQAVLTHQGRSSSSGHYVAWVKHKEDNWIKCDDEKLSIVKEEDILKLSGGGDWHVAYTLLYGPKRLEIWEDEKKDEDKKEEEKKEEEKKEEAVPETEKME